MNTFGCMKIQPYVDTYEELFAPLKDKPVTILELGVLSGASLLMWNEYFTHPNREIIGLDMNPPVNFGEEFELSDHNVFQYQGQQDDIELLEVLKVKHGAFDIIIDDASHRADPSRVSFNELFESVKPGGLYIIEDWGTGYWAPERGFDGQYYAGWRTGNHVAGMVGFVKQMVDLVGSQDWGVPRPSSVHSVEYRWGQCIIRKKS